MAKSVRVRMYRQGLGDCFLLTIPAGETESHVLIDCGVLKGTEAAEKRMQRVAQDIAKTTSKSLDALVVTHEHWDHLSGFLQADTVFKDIKVREVWLAWTEDPNDEMAQELGARKKLALRAIHAAAQRLAGVQEPGALQTARQLDSLLGFYGGLGAAGRKTTGDALAWVKNLPNAKIRYFVPGCEPFAPAGAKDIRVYSLGPPRDKKLLRKSNPSKKASEVYELAGPAGADLGFFAAVGAGDTASASVGPFPHWFQMSDDEARGQQFFAERYWGDEEQWRRIENSWLDASARMALQLDSDTNNTSLALAFELIQSRRVLLFPGDAQVGNWLSWQGLQWQIKEDGEIRIVTARDLLARTVLYKVGHHGSHNATLREAGLEEMISEELTAMIPVSRETAKKMDWKMPFDSLFRRLQEKTRGRILDRDLGVPKDQNQDANDAKWQQFLACTDVQDDWIDYHVEM